MDEAHQFEGDNPTTDSHSAEREAASAAQEGVPDEEEGVPDGPEGASAVQEGVLTMPKDASAGQVDAPAEDVAPADSPFAAVRRAADDDGSPYAFVSHRSAIEALRSLSARDLRAAPRWPPNRRMLPVMGQCVTTQRQFKRFVRETDLSAHGIVSRPVDLLVPSPYLRSRGKGARLHVWERVLPERCMLRLDKNLLVSGPAMVAVELLSSQAKLDGLLDAFVDEVRAQSSLLRSMGIDESPKVELPLHWERLRRIVVVAAIVTELAGTYRLPTDGGTVRYHMPRLLRVADVRNMADDPSARFIGARLRAAAGMAFDDSASPRETALALMLSMPLDYGGFGLPKPRLNLSIDVSGERGAVADRNVVTPDLVWAEQRVVLEYDSGEFHGGGDARRLGEDAVRSNTLAAMGFVVLRATTGSVATLPQLELLARQVARCLGVGLAQASDIQLTRRRKVFGELMLGRG